jgi:uncharacterized protein (TIGR03032 family)
MCLVAKSSPAASRCRIRRAGTTGKLLLVDIATGKWQAVAELPGFARGLSIVGPYAFIGLSKIREKSAMTGVPLAERRDQLKCSVAVVDLRTAHVVALLEFQTAVEEIFDARCALPRGDWLPTDNDPGHVHRSA